MTADLRDLLAELRIDIEDEVATQHLATITAELRTARARPVSSRRARRRLVAVVGAALVVVLPAAAGIAAENSVPGDVLYPVKRATEWVRSFADADLAADHRVDELETVLDRDGAPNVVSERLRDAEAVVADLDPTDPIRDRLEAARARIDRTDQVVDATTTTTTARDQPPPAPTTTGPRDEPRPATTTTVRRGEAPRTTTTAGRRDEPPPPTRITTAPRDDPPPTTTTTAPRDAPPPGNGRGDNRPGDG